jgi:hypothetical protein
MARMDSGMGLQSHTYLEAASHNPFRDTLILMSQPAIIVLSCQAHRDCRQKAIRDTWARRVPEGVALYFVEGGHERTAIEGDRLLLPVPDGYDDLAEKCFHAVKLVLAKIKCSGIIKCDDDTYLHPQRCIDSVDTFGDYCGNPAEGQEQFPGYAQGGCYWLSRKAMMKLTETDFSYHADAPWYKGNSPMRKLGERAYRKSTSIEDVMVGSLLAGAGIALKKDKRFCEQVRPIVYLDTALFSNHYVSPSWMYRIHRMGSWPQSWMWRLIMRIWTLLPSAAKPR